MRCAGGRTLCRPRHARKEQQSGISAPDRVPLRECVLCLRFPDRRTLEFPALVTTAGWLRHRESAARSGRCIRSRYEGGRRCSVCAKSPIFRPHLQGS